MDHGAEIQFCLKNEQRRIFCPVGKPSTIARYFWHFFRNLSGDQWEALGSKLLNDVKWVKGDDIEDAEIEKYNSIYRWECDEKGGSQVRYALAIPFGSPAYALNMILQGKLNHMVYVGCENDQEKENTRHLYRVDFKNRLLYYRPKRPDTNKSLNRGKDKGWMRIPFITPIDNDNLIVFDDCHLFKDIERTQRYLEDGPNMF